MTLTGVHKKLLKNAILSGFNKEALEELVRFDLDERLDAIVPIDSETSTIVFRLIEWAEQHGKMKKLIPAVQAARPDNQVLQSVARELLLLDEPAKAEDSPPVTPPGPTDEETRRWDRYRLSVRKHLEELLEKLGREGSGSRVLVRVAEVLEIEDAPGDEDPLRERISTYLCNSRAEHAMGDLMGLHDELCAEGSDRLAEVIWHCVGQLFSLCLPRKVLTELWRQHEGPEFVFFHGTVATEVGADAALAVLDGKGSSILTHALGLRGKYWIPFEWPAPNGPSLEEEVLAVFEHLAVQSLPPNEGMRRHQRDEVTARIDRLSKGLSGWLANRTRRTGRTPYCTLALLKNYGDAERKKQVLERVRKRVPSLWFLELNPDSDTLEQEYAMIECSTARSEWEGRRKSR
jgi:hypothetical protein